MHFDYSISDKMTLRLKPGLNYFIPTITKEEYVLDARLYRFGLMAGVKYGL